MIDRAEGGDELLAEVATGSYFYGMKTVGIKELKNKLSEYVRLAAAGERVLVTDRGKVVAELREARDINDPLMDDPWFAEQVRLGHITPATNPSNEPLHLKRDYPLFPLEEILRDLDESREDRF